MEKLRDSRFSEILYDSNLELIVHKWLENSKFMDESDFRHEMEELKKIFEQYKPKRVLVDQREFYFIVLPSQQSWVDQNVNKYLYEIGVEKVAFVVSPDFISKVSVDQVFSSGYSILLRPKFFEDYQEALNWIKT